MDEQFVHEDQMRNARTQGVGSMVSEQNRQNALELMRKMHKIDTQNAAAKARIENNLDKALQCVDNVRDFVGSPEHILEIPKQSMERLQRMWMSGFIMQTKSCTTKKQMQPLKA